MALLGSALLLTLAVPAMATGPYGFQNSEGCDGTGFTYLQSTNVIRSETDAWLTGTSSDCHYSYLAGNYKSVGGTWVYGVGQGWISGGWNAHNVSNAVEADQVAHSGCSTNTPSCPGVTYAFTGYY